MASDSNDINTYFGRCRCCLDYGYLRNMWEEYHWRGEKEIYVEMLVQCFALSWEPSENSTENDCICDTCVTKLRDANSFKKTILESQARLLEEIDEDTNAVKVENQESSFEYKEEVESKSSADNEPENPYFVDVNDPDYVDPDVTIDTEYEDVEYLEDDDETVDPKQTPRKVRRSKQPQKPSDKKWPKKLPSSERYKTYKQYTEDDLHACLDAVKSKKMTIKAASEKYHIPVKTIQPKLKMDTKNDQNGITTKERSKLDNNKTLARIKPTIFREHRLETKDIRKIVTNIKKKYISIVHNDNNKDKDEVKNECISNIKNEIDVDLPIDIKKVRTKYKAIVNDKFKKDCDESEKTDANQMNKHKNNLRHILECSNATMIKGFWGNGYSCCFCKIIKENPLELKAHNLEMHYDIVHDAIKVKYVSDLVIRLDITDLKCKLCNRNIDSLETLTDHLEIQHNKNIYKDIKNHLIPFKFDTDILQCVKCNKEFKYFKLLSEHMSEHYNNYECPICERSFVNKQSMQTHSYRHRNGIFKCSHCPKIFDTRPKRSVHERVTHALSNKTRKCTYCEERFSTKDLVQSHESKVHGAKIQIFNCQACNKSYNSQSSLVTHRKRFHLMLRPHKCSYCDMAFFSRIELRSHIVTHTKARDFECNMCRKSFGTRCSLNQHVKGHLNDRKFKCDECDRTFVHRTAFKVHMRSKHGQVV